MIFANHAIGKNYVFLMPVHSNTTVRWGFMWGQYCEHDRKIVQWRFLVSGG